MKIQREWLDARACGDAIKAGMTIFGEKKEYELDRVLDWLEREKKYNWGCWLFSYLMPHKQQVQFAIYSAELVLDVFERKYPEDKRPREATEAARNYLKNPSDKTREAAKASADSVYSAARFTAYFANSVYSAARFAAYSAAYSAYSAAYSAAHSPRFSADAAYAAAYSANSAAKNNDSLKEQCFRYGRKLLIGDKEEK